MGTHPIFESDFDCLTDMKNRKVYSKRKNNGHNNGFTPSNGLFKVTIKNDEQSTPNEPVERVFNSPSPIEPQTAVSPKVELMPVKTTPRIIKTTMKTRPVVETNQLLEPEERGNIAREEAGQIKEATKAAQKLEARTSGEFQFPNEHLEELEEFSLP